MNRVPPRPPRCFLGCGDVQTWTLVISYIKIVFLSLMLLEKMFSFPKSPLATVIESTFIIMAMNINIKLRNGVLKRDIKPVRLWLCVYSILFIFMAVLIIVGMAVVTSVNNQNTDHQREKRKFVLTLIECTLSEGITALAYRPVYQYYMFEKSLLRRRRARRARRRQTI